MSSEILLSYCIPVYNVKDYLEACIESIYRQNLSAFEIVCVDDCSTDGSFDLLNELAERYPEMVVLRNEVNGGISVARNHAIRAARGKYIWLVDADDLIAPDSAPRFLKLAEKESADAVLGDFLAFQDGTEPVIREGTMQEQELSFADPRYFYPRAENHRPCFGVWLGIFNREFLLKNNLLFREELRIFEEYTFYLELGMKMNKVFHLAHYGYLYRLRESSNSHGARTAVMKKGFENSRKALKIYEQYRDICRPDLRHAYDLHYKRMQRYVVRDLCLVDDSSYVKQGLKEIQKEGLHPYRYDPGLEFGQIIGRKMTFFNKMIAGRYTFWIMHWIVVKVLR